ncbi:MAG TPA: dihydrodipicolinate synthase family protein [Bauldia sp.]|nr:dihydrodipicolinate synthase family protein [Bauldia sp.]
MTIRGNWPMLYAFFGGEGGLRQEAFVRQIDVAKTGGAAGGAVPGPGTEVAKLSLNERRTVVEWVAAATAGRLPFAVTIADGNVGDMIESARHARDAGAAWLILQPPRPPVAEDELIRFFGAVADAVDIPVGIQNAPEFLGIGLSNAGLVALNRAHPNVTVVKAESGAMAAGRLIDTLEGRMAVFNGRAGLELTDNWRAGVDGMIPGIETIDRQGAIEALMRAGDEDAAEALYREILPALTFAMAGIEHFVFYGKRLAAARLGIAPSGHRLPSLTGDARGLAWIARFAAALGPLP